MTGLDPQVDVLIEVAVVVTDSELTLLDDGLDILIATEPAKLEGMLDVVREMHTSSGLLEALQSATTTLEEAEQQVLDYVKRFVPERRKAPLCGNSIATDRTFLAKYMPALDDHLHYRMVDVSSIKEGPAVVSPRLLQRSREARRPPGPRRHRRLHHGAALLPSSDVRPATRTGHGWREGGGRA